MVVEMVERIFCGDWDQLRLGTFKALRNSGAVNAPDNLGMSLPCQSVDLDVLVERCTGESKSNA